MNESIDKLNSLLQGELSACETYEIALEKAKEPEVVALLTECQSSHKRRVAKLTAIVTESGGTPVTSSGPWGAFAKLVEGGAAVFGESAAIGSLEEGEDHGLKSYNSGLEKLAPQAADIIETDLRPAQEHTYQLIAQYQSCLVKRKSA
jgi:uncharacterized protein (TIGR02284 family)